MRGYAGWGGAPRPPVASALAGSIVVPQLPTSALSAVMARAVWNELTKLDVRQPLCASAYRPAAANSRAMRRIVSAGISVILAAHSGVYCATLAASSLNPT